MEIRINGWPISAPFHSIDDVHKIPHQGIDFAIPESTPIPSITDGVVTRVTDEGAKSFGKAVWVHSNDGKDVVYGHLSQPEVHVGQILQTGDEIGLSGNTGHSTGPHVHIQVMQDGHAIDPTPLIQPTKDIPWWDIEGHMQRALENSEHWLGSEIHRGMVELLHAVGDFMGVALPTAALIGVLWWMCPFFPRSDKAPKLVGASLIVYLFYTLIRSV